MSTIAFIISNFILLIHFLMTITQTTIMITAAIIAGSVIL